MPARFLLAILVVGIGSLSPTLPDRLARVTEHKVRCCADMNAETSHSCPINSGSSNSTVGSTCCSAQAPCFVGYADGTNEFVVQMSRANLSNFANARVSARSQRPPVPPPRSEFLS